MGYIAPRAQTAGVAISARSDAEWRAVCEVMGKPELASDDRFATVEARMLAENQDALDAMIEAWTAERADFEAMDALQAKGVAAAAVQHPEDRMDKDANSLEWETFPEVKHLEMGRVRVEGMPMKLSKTPGGD